MFALMDWQKCCPLIFCQLKFSAQVQTRIQCFVFLHVESHGIVFDCDGESWINENRQFLSCFSKGSCRFKGKSSPSDGFIL